MSFRSFRKDLECKMEEDRTFAALQNAEAALTRHRDEYAAKAKEALRAGNRSQYAAYVALLKKAMFDLAQAQDMTANFIIARDLRNMQDLSQKFVRAIDNVMKDVYKTSKSINVKASQDIFLKSVAKQHYVSAELKSLLEENRVAFSSSVTALTDISDDEVKAILQEEIRRDGGDLDDTLKKLEKEFSVKNEQTEVKRPMLETESAAATSAPEALPPVSAPAAPPEDTRPAVAAPAAAESDPAPGKREPSFGKETPRESARVEEPKEAFDVDNIAFRPKYLRDYVGQPNAVATVSDPIKKARLTGRPLPHILICGSYGQGKTTLAKIIANEMKGNFITVSAAVKHREMLRILRDLHPNDILFIDEVHKLGTDVIETLLYPAMEDFEVHVTESTNIRTQTKTVRIAPFTLIGATTETGKLLKPFYSKFPINVTLVDYKLETIAAIVKNSFRVTNIGITDELAYAVARRSRLSPRMANAYVNGIGASAIVREAERRNLPDGSLRDEKTVRALNIRITEKDVNEYFERLGVDELGLREEERKILHVVIDMYHGGPVGQENLAKALNMATNRIDQEYEPYLIKLGFLNVRPQGRYATDAAYKYLGYTSDPPADAQVPPAEEAPADAQIPPAEETPADTKNEPPMSEGTPFEREDELPVTSCEAGPFNAEAARWIDALFSGEGKPSEASLDDLFPGVGKEYDSAATNRCILRVEGGREIYCDSHLERRFLKTLFENGYIVDARSEALELEYASSRMSGKRYYPDFVLKLRDGRIAVVEMKNLSSMGYHLNIDKYEELAMYCSDNGYLYAEIARDDETGRYISAEQLKSMPVQTELAELVRGKIGEKGIFNGDDLRASGYDIRALLSLLLNDRTLKNIDRTGRQPQIVSAEE